MAKRKKKNKHQNKNNNKERQDIFTPSHELKRLIVGITLLFFGLALILAFFNLAGSIGSILNNLFVFLVGRAVLVIPFVCLFAALIFFRSPYKKFVAPLVLSILLLILGVSGIVGAIETNGEEEIKNLGGSVGNLLNLLVVKLFGFWLSQIIFIIMSSFGVIIMWHILRGPSTPRVREVEREAGKPTFIKKIFSPKFRQKEIPSFPSGNDTQERVLPEIPNIKNKGLEPQLKNFLAYKPPPLELLAVDKGEPSSGDTKTNSAIIRKTLQNFDIPVEMSEVSIGPTVTQYTLKPAEGVKLSKITTLNNDLSLALAAHPIRIEAPIPGRSLVGIEIPNKVRAQVRMRGLISNPEFQLNTPGLTLAIGRDVGGKPFYTDLAKMPHMLVAGSTGSGKTIFLNSLLINLLYKNSPATLRLILVDPKRVEFPVYSDIPHLLCPVIYSPTLACNALKWLTGEMERRFDLLVEAKSRDIIGYNEVVAKQINSRSSSREGDLEPMPYIVLVIDELADLMSSKGREIEGAIVRIAQMARAVGIHLVLATQRPSVEVITGLIKANITSRVTFQVASQVDSRTILDASGAEKLLGAGDMLYVSGEIAKPKRIQCAYLQEKEVRGVVDYIKSNTFDQLSGRGKEILEDTSLSENLNKALLEPESENGSGSSQDDDTLYEEAKRIVIEAKKASASLLQRRLRIGYARAARLIDMLEAKGVVSPAEGAKPREIYLGNDSSQESMFDDNDDGWKKV